VIRPVNRDFDVESGPHAAGKKVVVANGCFRCHTINLVRGPIGIGDADGGSSVKLETALDLRTTGANPQRTVEWFMALIRNPEPRAMPSYEGKINDRDLRALAEYLANLK
jgi:mono/diheme cytochrome c family protein